MSEKKAIQEHDWLRLAQDDAALLWGIVSGFAERMDNGERWPRLERILFDLEVIMRKKESNMNDQKDILIMITKYIGFGRVSLSNIASHFGIDREVARDHLRVLQKSGAIRRLGASLLWEAS